MLAKEFVEVGIVSQECFEDATYTLHLGLTRKRNRWVSSKRTMQQSHPPKHNNERLRRLLPVKTRRRKTPRNRKPLTLHCPPPPPSQGYVTPPFAPPLVPLHPQVPLGPQPSYEEGSDDVLMLRRVPPPSPFTAPLPVPPPSGITCLSQGVQPSQATSSTQSLQTSTLPFRFQATPSSQIPVPHLYVYT